MKPLPWFRAYIDMVDDEKLRLLAFEDRWHFVALLCCKGAGLLDRESEPTLFRRKIAVKLGLGVRELEEVARRLAEVGLIDAVALQPIGWGERQFQSDSSYERVKRHREKRVAAGLVQQVSIPRSVRDFVFNRDGMRCVYCAAGDDLTLDHDVPEMRGGSHDADNLLTACRRCNASKRDMTASEFVERNGIETFQKRSKSQTKTTEAKIEATKAGARAALVIPDWLPADAWKDWHEYRNSRKGWTHRARALSLRTLTELWAQGQDPRAVINQAIERGWTGLFPVRRHDSGVTNANPSKLSAADRTRANAIAGERADAERDSAAAGDGRAYLVGSHG